MKLRLNLSAASFRKNEEKLKRSVEIMLSEYGSDKELIALTAIDGEDFPDA